MNSTKAASILIVDDHPMVREALAMRISMTEGLEICGETETEAEALQLVEQISPDLVLVDISLKIGNGIELIKRIVDQFPNTKCLVISTYPESLYAERAIRAGAMGYCNKQEPNENITKAIHTVLQGDKYLSPQLLQRFAEQGSGALEPSAVSKLSNREFEVFQLIGNGMTSSAVANRLGLSIHTVDTYRQKIKQKIGVKNSVELQREAVRWVMENC